MALVKVRLYGKLRQFGRDFQFNVHSKREVINALCCQIKGFKQFLMNAHKQGLQFAILEDNTHLTADEIKFSAVEGRTIRIAPVIMGSKSSGLFSVILGVVLIAVGVFAPVSAAAGMALIAGGAGMALGGVAQMLSPTTKKTKGYEQDGNVASYGFGGAVTTTAQGNPVPLVYGKRLVGGAIISAGIYAEDKA